MTQSPPSPSVANLPTQALFLFGRANYFNTVAKKRNCGAFDAQTLKSISDRFEAVRLKLAAKYGDPLFPADKPVNAPISDGACDATTLGSYSAHVEELEHFVADMPPQFSGGAGSSLQDAVVIHAKNDRDGTKLEYTWVSLYHPGGKVTYQSLISSNGRMYDSLDVTAADGSLLKFYFDISEFFGKRD